MRHPRSGPVGSLALVICLPVLPGCRDCAGTDGDPERAPAASASASASATAAPAKVAKLINRWDPKTGRGHVEHRYANGDRVRTCFHCKFEGYTGGLLIGGFNGSGMGLAPRKPIRGHRRINVFCAQDESIWDLTDEKEYTYGWSENYGRGPDGERLKYVRGRVIHNGPDRVTLQSENAGGCYRVRKVATTRADARYWVIATRVFNRCDHPIRFSLFTGDDPWIGLYRSSEGDVGWTEEKIVRRESVVELGAFFAGGLYDLGNSKSGEREGSFSNQANFIALDPTLPLPSFTAFANSFAHRAADVDPERPLDNQTMTALNLGWVDQRLKPEEGLTIAMALGLADTAGRVGQLPQLPAIPDEDWSVWRKYLSDRRLPSRAASVDFVSERVNLDLGADRLTVHGIYYLFNRGSADTSLAIRYPILTSEDRPAPTSVEVDGSPHPVATNPDAGAAEAKFQIDVPGRSLRRFEVRYEQPHSLRRAAYMVTSARSWPNALDRAVFVVRHPKALGSVKLSYPVTHTRAVADVLEQVVVVQPFAPDREFELSW